jgi:CheY-like chemotaxis protein
MAAILVAEDRAVQRDQMRRILAQAGHSVTVVRNGVEAIDHYTVMRHDVVIMDLFMPCMNGLDAIVHLIRMFPGVRVIAMCDGSGKIGWQALRTALNLGAAGAVEKPLHHSPLLRLIEETLAA